MKNLPHCFVLSVLAIGLKVCCAEMNCDLEKMETEILKSSGYLGDAEYSYPTNENELKVYCQNLKEGNEFGKEFAQKCLKGSSKTILSILAYSSQQESRKSCSKNASPKLKQTLFGYAKCVNSNKPKVMECFQKNLEKMNVTYLVEPARNKLPYLCCLKNDMINCIFDELRKSNHPSCTNDILEDLAKFLDQQSANLMNTFCDEDAESSDRCEKLLENMVKHIKPGKWKTPFRILFKIFEDL